MIRGALPSITATAEFVVPRSIPMTWPLTFFSPPSEYNLAEDEDNVGLAKDVRHSDGGSRGINWIRYQKMNNRYCPVQR